MYELASYGYISSMQIKQFNRQNIEQFHRELDQVINAFALSKGLMANPHTKMSFSAGMVKTTVEFRTDGLADATVTDPFERRMLASHGLQVGTRLRSTKHGYCTVYGYNSRAGRYPILARATDGRTIKFGTYGLSGIIVDHPVAVVTP